MAVVARLLPRHWEIRHWDGRRLLRFLTGLALLALAFTGRIDAHAAPAPTDAARAPATVQAPHGPSAKPAAPAGVASDPAAAPERHAMDPVAAPARVASDPIAASEWHAVDPVAAAGRDAMDPAAGHARQGTGGAGEPDGAHAHPVPADVAEAFAARPGPAAIQSFQAAGAAHPSGSAPGASGPRAPPIA
ncbi:hypothetical protein EV385_0859 [Krasilnikovia cinnamomea]|uniref:Uncharacterized protein n=1 Tax=Krasilnikovia cinnamomea TaxID=349313 RepID=A0A4Q7ZFL5_9ACTN|nr:hypothetical protein [Krasilnikovia cinnamomea]RZU49124.1 hypothetical protein EV385_0859 [Krasilnikovia cinnamomea]